MTRSRSLAFFLAVAGVTYARATHGQSFPVDVEVGYRWLDISGNEDMYRTQINDRPGFLVRSFSYDSPEPVGNLFDHVHLDMSDVGAGPAGLAPVSGCHLDSLSPPLTRGPTLPSFALHALS